MPKKVDTNQPDIVSELRQTGMSVQTLHMVGKGCPDIVVGFRGENFLFEIKYGRGKLNDLEYMWHQDWEGQVHVIRSAEEAIEIINDLTT